MNVVESIELSKILKLVAKPTYILGTTYTLSLAFFESVVFPCIDRSKLKSCLIIADELGYRRALTEAAALQGAAQDYIVVPAPTSGAFHAKVWILVSEDEAVLLVGSGNLTQAGFITNAELFDVILLSRKELNSRAIVADIQSFLKGLIGMWAVDDGMEHLCTETLKEIERSIASFPILAAQTDRDLRFLHSFQGDLLDQLPQGLEAQELFIAAPFFGGATTGVELFADRYTSAKLNLFPAIHGGKATDIPLKQISKIRAGTKVSQLSVPTKKGAFAHLKLYGIAKDEDSAWLCCTSANCTNAAWRGPNIEAGLLRFLPRSVMAGYFFAGSTKFPDEKLQRDTAKASAALLKCWATDTGSGLDLLIANVSRHHLPLSEVILTIRFGSNFAVCKRPIICQDGHTAHFAWTSFVGWERRKKVAICLELLAKDSTGQAIRADVLVENRLLLQADPLHRNAWRGALALLDAEGAPELADIAAIFTLAHDMFEGTTVRPSHSDEIGGQSKTGDKKELTPPGVAIWPPQPDPHDLGRKIGSTALGHLHWFQHIFQIFLNADPTTTHEAETNHLPDEDQDEQNGESKAEDRRVVEEESLVRALKKTWDLSSHDYNRIREKLTELCPTAVNAPNIWPASIFALLSTLAVLRYIRRKAPAAVHELKAGYLCDDFLRAMFSERKQDPDFCCPDGFRYRSERFPPLADDLEKVFKAHPVPALANVLLRLIIDRQMRSQDPQGRMIGARRLASRLLGQPPYAADRQETCRRLWKRFIRDTSRFETDDDFDVRFREIISADSSKAE